MCFKLRLTQYELKPFYNPAVSLLNENHTSGAQFEPEKIIVCVIFNFSVKIFHWKFQFHRSKSQNLKVLPAMKYILLK